MELAIEVSMPKPTTPIAIQFNRAEPSGVGQNLNENNPKNGPIFVLRQTTHGAIQSNLIGST